MDEICYEYLLTLIVLSFLECYYFFPKFSQYNYFCYFCNYFFFTFMIM